MTRLRQNLNTFLLPYLTFQYLREFDKTANLQSTQLRIVFPRQLEAHLKPNEMYHFTQTDGVYPARVKQFWATYREFHVVYHSVKASLTTFESIKLDEFSQVHLHR